MLPLLKVAVREAWRGQMTAELRKRLDRDTRTIKDLSARSTSGIKAVNVYDELVAALRGLLDEIIACVTDGTLPKEAVDSNAGVVAARAALAKVEGK
jgi:hypothetical protein